MCRRDEAYIVSHFAEALEQGRIQAFFQPVFASIAGMIISAEALARWRDPDGGMLSPADFIPALEKHGLIYDLDMEVLRQTCAFYRALRDRGTPVPCFSVNLSRLDFSRGGDARLFERVVETLGQYGVPHEAIKLEITESLMLEDIGTFRKLFRQFRDAGFTLWIDDFGSGYSSLNVLQSYSFDVVKFDMQFLHNFTPKGRQLLASLIRMAKSLGMHTLTEGVEAREQQDFLISVGCELQQGFFYSRPLSGADFMAFIDGKRNLLGTQEDKIYWRQIGRLNFLSANPLDDYARMEQAERGEAQDAEIETPNACAYIDNAGVPLALVECGRNKALHVYVNNSYLRRVQELGYASIDALERAFNDHRSDQYLMVKKLVTDAISLGTRQTVEYVNNDVYYRLSAKCLAKQRDRAMLALRLTTFDSEREIQTAREMLNYGNSLFSTYELVVVIYPDSGISSRIYTSNNLPSYDRAGSLAKSIQRFCECEVMPVDQARYLRFMDFETMTQRIESSPKGFIQSSFRLCWDQREGGCAGGDVGPWYTARVSRIPASTERAYLLTIQSHPANEARYLDVIARDHPEILE